ncbi:MAG: hypothetical protein ACLQQ4_17190 [Bacteroidia bacterium]
MNSKSLSLIAIALFGLATTALHAQVGINNSATNPDPSAILDLMSGNSGVNKGFLPNAVALTATNSASPVTSPATGLIVYNTATAGASPNNVVPGYYYWNGTAWIGLGGYASGSGTNNYIARWTPTGNSLGTGMIQDNGSSVGINASPNTDAMLSINNTGTGLYTNSSGYAGDSSIGATYGVYGMATNYGSAGVYGNNNWGTGVYGNSANQTGVYGFSSCAGKDAPPTNPYGGIYGEGDNTWGVQGVSASGAGVLGVGKYAGYFTGSTQGVYSNSTGGAGDSSVGTTYGVYGNSSNYLSAGVFGTSTSGYGVKGNSSNADGIYGYSIAGPAGPPQFSQYGGVFGEDDNTWGIEGSSIKGTGVYGNGGRYGGYFTASSTGVYSNSTFASGDSSVGLTYGVYGSSSKNGYPGVYGNNPNGYGVWGNSTNGTGVYGYSNATGGINPGGVYGENDNALGFGVEGYSSNGTGVIGNGNKYGGYFTALKGQGIYSSSTYYSGDSSIGNTYGVYAYSSATTGNYPGVYGTSKNGNGVNGYAPGGVGVYGNSSSNYGISGFSTSSTGVYGEGDNLYGVEGYSSSGTGVFAEGNSYGLIATYSNFNATTAVAAIEAIDSKSNGDVWVNAWSSGTHYKIIGSNTTSVSCSVPDLDGNKVVMHCPETPEFYFEDYGEGQLVNGKAHIDLDPILAKNVAINDKHHLRVFVQLDGDCKGVYVTNKTATGFDVVELDGGTSNTSFEWHVICNVKDENENGVVNHNQDLRFEKAPIVDASANAKLIQQAPAQTITTTQASGKK